MQKEFSMVTLDHIYYQDERIHDLVAILIDGEYKTVKLNDKGSKSIHFFVIVYLQFLKKQSEN